ncbi:aldolase [Paenibacillus sp. MWE-103]|uniref:Aldolase n=1 Tax=Paenibacillus artemisiicola TaxID=1172618 RepID=A0ABS3WHJ4_9BACL|nr:aldolase [Paenibacillus artemisiicola]MBO7747798.1 aldolase [Paenibacillus artemisiicola]
MDPSVGSDYKAFGMILRSEIPLPELHAVERYEGPPDIQVVLGDLHSTWEGLSANQGIYAYEDLSYLLNIPDVAIFRVSRDGIITVCPAADCSMRKLRLFLLGSCMGVMLLYRNLLPLHGSAVVIGEQAYAIVGQSGAGKSTLAAALLHEGFKLLTDDVIAISMDPNTGMPTVIPSYPQQKLWEESVAGLQMKSSGLETLYQNDDRPKYAIPVREQFANKSIPLAGIFELVKTDNAHPTCEPLHGLERLPLLFRHTYRNYHIPLLGLMEWHFQFTTRMTEEVDVYRLSRPVCGFKVNELVSIFLKKTLEGVSVS